ncbi:MAG: hypothetical protein R6V16_13105 [Bacteroidales bacterium]
MHIKIEELSKVYKNGNYAIKNLNLETVAAARELLDRIGVTEIYDFRATDVIAEVGTVDLVIDPVGGPVTDASLHWLAFHILGQDQHMARQIEAIRKGVAPEVAYAAEGSPGIPTMEEILPLFVNGPVCVHSSPRNIEVSVITLWSFQAISLSAPVTTVPSCA